MHAPRADVVVQRSTTVLLCVAGTLQTVLLTGGNPISDDVADAALRLLVGALLLAAAVVIDRRRVGTPDATARRHLAVDTAIVTLGAWLAASAAIGPTLGNATALVWSIHPPLAVAATFIVMRRVLRDGRPPATDVLLGGGFLAVSAAGVVDTLIGAARLGTEWWLGAVVLGLVGWISIAASRPSNGGRPSLHTPRRPVEHVVLMATFLAAPVIVLAATSPHDAADRIVRSVVVGVLTLAVAARLVAAVAADERATSMLLHGANTDPLTGLPNRTVLLHRINDLLRTSWDQDLHPTIFCIDLDRFKNINDSLGHAAGDEVLTLVARRLVESVPDVATVARLSGDEYAVLHPSITSVAEAMNLADALLALFREPLPLSNGDVFVSASIGVAAINATTTTAPEDLVRHADTAMYRAKDAGRNCVAVYDESMHERVAHRLAVETALYRALDRRELCLFHQPILDMTSGDVVGFEALMRWRQSDGTMVPPDEFIPIAEDTGTIIPIGSWALLDALIQLQEWITEGVCGPQATMSVNVSPRQLSDPNFPSIVSEAITRSGASPDALWIEVTESVMISEPELAFATLRRLRALGVMIALDDFGTGYSSLSLLQKFPLQRLKIDRAFVKGVADNPNDRSLVRTIVAMGRSLGLDLVAEGVESIHQLQVLNDLGCHKAQGYLISHPVPADAMRSTVAALERLGRLPGLDRSLA